MRTIIKSIAFILDETEIVEAIKKHNPEMVLDNSRIKKMKVIYDDGKFLSVELEYKKPIDKKAEKKK